MRGRKRQWEHEPQLHSKPGKWIGSGITLIYSVGNGYVQVGAPAYDTYRTDRQYDSQDMLPPRKRLQHTMIPSFDVINGAPLQSQSMSLQS
jgi:hypothetical protein